MESIKVLVVDDSRLFRQIVSYGLNQDKNIKVVAMAADPFQARDMILRFKPDVMTLDIEMPRMNGIDFLKKLMPQYPIATVMLSCLNESVFDAMNAGAVEFVNKPVNSNADQLSTWVKEELIEKVKIAATAKIGKNAHKEGAQITHGRNYKNKILAMGASTGGTEALSAVISKFDTDIPGTVVVQHMPPGFTKMYAERLDKQCKVAVKEAENGDLVEQGKILIAPGDKQMRLTRSGDIYRVEVKAGEKVSGHCPSVDVLFQSVAKTAASDAVGVIMTGMGSDGAAGLLAMRRAGARTIGQDEKSCVVYGMPKVAFDIGAVAQQVSLENIASKVYNMFNTMP